MPHVHGTAYVYNMAFIDELLRVFSVEKFTEPGPGNVIRSKSGTNMLAMLTSSQFIDAFEDGTAQYRGKVTILVRLIAEAIKITKLQIPKQVLDEIQGESESDSQIAEVYKLIVDAVNTRANPVPELATLSISRKAVFNADDFVSADVRNRNHGHPSATMRTFDESGIDPFMRLCSEFGNRLGVGTMMGSVEELVSNLKSAMVYYYKNIADGEPFTGTTIVNSSVVLNTTEAIVGRTIKEMQGRSIKSAAVEQTTLDNADVSLRFIEYGLDIVRDRDVNTMDEFGKRLAALRSVPPSVLAELRGKRVVGSSIDGLDARTSNTILKFLSAPTGQGTKAAFMTVQQTIKLQKRPYWWQQRAIVLAKERRSFIIVGPTSGGKTYAAGLIIASLLGSQDRRFVYSAPTDLLAIQTFAGFVVSFKELSDRVAIICGCATYIPTNARVYVGTPKELRDYLTRVDPDAGGSTTAELLMNSVLNAETVTGYDLVVDECHTMSEEYDPTDTGRVVSRATEELMGIIGSGVFVGLSATLSNASVASLVHRVSTKTGIRDIELIQYDYSDVGVYTEPTTPRLETPLPQERYPVRIVDGIVTKAESPAELQPIEITMELLDQLVYTAKAENLLPCLMFFDTEAETIARFRSYLAYIKNRTQGSRWSALSKQYHHTIERGGSINKDGNSLFDINQDFLQVVLAELKTRPTENTDVIPPSLIEEHLKVYERYAGAPLGYAVANFDVYALLDELRRFSVSKRFFDSPVHPFYNFSQKRDTVVDEGQDFIQLLRAQDIDVRDRRGFSLLENIRNGLEYGVSVITSSLPLGFQMETMQIVNSLKKGTLVQSSLTFGDDGVAQGIDLPFKSVIICRSEYGPMQPSKFFQENGRCGRNTGSGRFDKSRTMTVNVSNIFDIRGTEDLSFSQDVASPNYFKPNELAERLIHIVRSANAVINEGVPPDSMIDESLFPGVITDTTKKSERIRIVKSELRELYEVCKVMCPRTAADFIQPIYSRFMNEGNALIMNSAI
jgi:hypothetical protein